MGTMTQAALAHRLTARSPREPVDAGAAVGASLAAGSVFLTLLVAFSVGLYDEPVWKIPQMIAATVGSAPARLFEPTLALLGVGLHFALALLYGLAFAGLTTDLRRTASLGIAFGVALYFVNLHGFTHLFPWFAELRTLDTLAAHVFFGLLLANLYRNLAEE
jgi:hypothetical protein